MARLHHEEAVDVDDLPELLTILKLSGKELIVEAENIPKPVSSVDTEQRLYSSHELLPGKRRSRIDGLRDCATSKFWLTPVDGSDTPSSQVCPFPTGNVVERRCEPQSSGTDTEDDSASSLSDFVVDDDHVSYEASDEEDVRNDMLFLPNPLDAREEVPSEYLRPRIIDHTRKDLAALAILRTKYWTGYKGKATGRDLPRADISEKEGLSNHAQIAVQK